MNTTEELPQLLQLTGFRLNSTEGLVLFVEDTAKPVWFGDFEDGKLAIYYAKQEGNVLVNSTALVAVYLVTECPTFTLHTIFSGRDYLSDKVTAMIDRVIPEYTNWIMQQRNEEIANGNAITLH